MVDTPIGTNSPNYTLVSGDVGATIFCRVTATNASGSAQAFSNIVGPVAAAGGAVPGITTAPAVTVAVGGASVSCSTGTWTNSPTGYAYQWYSDETPDVAIPSATSATYVIDGGVIEEAFTPADLPGLLAWYDATVGVTQSGGLVSQWSDQSGNGYHLLQATSGNQPAFDATGFNTTHPAVVFASGKTMSTTPDTVARGTGSSMSGFAVIRYNNPGAPSDNGRLLTYFGTGQSADYDNAASAALLSFSAGSINTTCNSVVAAISVGAFANTDLRLGAVYNGTNAEVYRNNTASGSPQAVVPAFTAGAGTLGIGALAPWAGPVVEIVVTTSALDSTQRASLDAYFCTKWGLAALRPGDKGT